MNLLEKHLLPSIKNKEKEKDEEEEDFEERGVEVFYLKMIGDYYRYLAEFLPESDSKNKAESYYNQAWNLAEQSLEETDPIRLGWFFF